MRPDARLRVLRLHVLVATGGHGPEQRSHPEHPRLADLLGLVGEHHAGDLARLRERDADAHLELAVLHEEVLAGERERGRLPVAQRRRGADRRPRHRLEIGFHGHRERRREPLDVLAELVPQIAAGLARGGAVLVVRVEVVHAAVVGVGDGRAGPFAHEHPRRRVVVPGLPVEGEVAMVGHVAVVAEDQVLERVRAADRALADRVRPLLQLQQHLREGAAQDVPGQAGGTVARDHLAHAGAEQLDERPPVGALQGLVRLVESARVLRDDPPDDAAGGALERPLDGEDGAGHGLRHDLAADLQHVEPALVARGGEDLDRLLHPIVAGADRQGARGLLLRRLDRALLGGAPAGQALDERPGRRERRIDGFDHVVEKVLGPRRGGGAEQQDGQDHGDRLPVPHRSVPSSFFARASGTPRTPVAGTCRGASTPRRRRRPSRRGRWRSGSSHPPPRGPGRLRSAPSVRSCSPRRP